MADHLVNRAAASIGKLLSFLSEIRDDIDEARALINLLGWELPPGLDDIGLATLDIGDFLEKLDAVIDAPVEEWEDEVAMLGRITDLISAINTVVGTVHTLASELPTELASFGDYVDRTQIHKELPKRLFDFLLANYLARRSPISFAILHLINVIDYPHFDADPENFQVEHVRATINYDSFETLFSDPAKLAEEAYGWNTPAFSPMTLLQRLNLLLQALGLRSRVQPLDRQAEETWLGRNVTEPDPMPQLLTMLHEERGALAGFRVGVSVFGARAGAEGEADGGLGFAPFIRGKGELSVPFFRFEDTFLDTSADADLLKGICLLLRPNEDLALRLAGGLSDAITGRFALGLRHGSPDSENPVVLPLPGGAGLSIGQIAVTAGVQIYSESPSESFLELALLGGKFSYDLTDADAFVRQNIPPRNIASPFELRVGWTNRKGIFFEGSSGLEATLPVHAEIGPFNLKSLTLGATVQTDGVQILSTVSGSLGLGPLDATVKGLGLRVNLRFEEGNLGLAGLSPAFNPPSGVGLSVDGGGFKGGGFLDFEPERARYAGMLELEFQDRLSLKAIGLLTTRLPSGEDGFSLLIVISGEFTPVQLGFGFTLNGVGGLLGLNRTVKTERLRTGIRDNTLSNILFPSDIVANADRIISDLRQVFPPQAGRFVFGPMARIGWGTPTLITVDLGLLIEVPEPVRLVILGVLRGTLPDAQTPLLHLQVNFLGEIDFERQQLAFDAALFDSRLLVYALSGDMAVRLSWGADPNFLLTVGGFHPSYEPPPIKLPSLRRLTIQLLDGDNPRLRQESYFAVTSNTVQFGSRVELYAAAGSFNVFGFLSFDVLFQFNPFYFVANVTAMLGLRVGSSSIAGIQLTLTLEGPTPWKVNGTASLRLTWFLKIKVRFSKTFGEERNTTLPDLAVLPLLLEALSARDNWEGELPARGHRLTSLKDTAELGSETIVVHPAGTLRISQKLVPLNIRIDRLGSQRPSDARSFSIGEVELGEDAAVAHPPSVQESFAPAQYFDLEDAEKLSSPSFKRFDSGIRVGDPQTLRTDYAAAREVKYELKYIDSERDRRLAPHRDVFVVDPVAFNTWSVQGAVARSDLSFARKRKSSLAPEAVATVPETFAIVTIDDLRVFDAASVVDNERAALTRIDELTLANPALRGKLQVVPLFETQR